MPLKFVFGPSGSGKSSYLYQHVIQESMKYPERNYIVLVPEQFTMQTQKDLVMMHERKGIMNIDVLSFARLAYRVFEETGGGGLPVLDDEGKNLILQKIAGDYESELKMLGGHMKKQGYISEVKSVISEFTQYDIGEDEIERVMESAGEASRLYYKLADIRLLYRGFTDYLREKYITKEELLDVLSREVEKSERLKNSTVVLDGFTGFTPVQDRLLGELMRHCREVIVTVTMDRRENPYVYEHPYQLFALSKQMVTSLLQIAKQNMMRHCREVIVTVTMDRRENPYVYEHPYQLFALSKQMVTSLLQIAKQNKIPVEEPVELYDHVPWRFKEQEALAFLEKHLFRYGAGAYEKEQEQVKLHLAKNPRKEAYAVAEQVRRMMREDGYRLRDIGVIVSDMDVYADHLKQAFIKYDIPFFMDYKRSILLNSFVEYIRSVLHMAEQSFSYESVFRFLRTNLAGFTYEEIDELENYVIGLGIKGYKHWQEKWTRKLKGMAQEDLDKMNHYRRQLVEKVDGLIYVLRQRRKTVADITRAIYEFMVGMAQEDLDKMNHYRRQLVEKVDGLIYVLRQRRKTVADITRAIYEFMVQENLQVRLAEQEELFKAKGELALAREYAQIYRIVIELFDKFVELLGDEQVSLSEYCKLLDAGLEEARVGVIPPEVDQVVIGDMQRTRLKDIKALLFAGANDVYLPGALLRPEVDQVVIGDMQRTRLKDIKALLFAGANDVYLPGALLRTGLLSELDREKFAREKLTLSAGGKEKAYVQKFYLYLNLTKPSEKLDIYYSKVSADGKSVRPSYLIQELRQTEKACVRLI